MCKKIIFLYWPAKEYIKRTQSVGRKPDGAFTLLASTSILTEYVIANLADLADKKM